MNETVIPYEKLSPEALNGVIEEFVTRDGTDYGEYEVPLETKVRQVRHQLEQGQAMIVFDLQTGTCNILPANDPAVRKLL